MYQITENKVFSFLLGLLIYLLGIFFVFSIIEVTPDELPSISDLFLVLLLCGISSFIAGFSIMWVNRARNFFPNFWLVVVISILALISFAHEGSLWSQISVVFVYGPISLSGGFCCKNYLKRDGEGV